MGFGEVDVVGVESRMVDCVHGGGFVVLCVMLTVFASFVF